MDATNVKQFKMDAGASGYPGMFWRYANNRNAHSSPIEAGDECKHVLIRLAAQRDSTQGYADEHPGWVKIDHPQGYWLPVMQHGKAVLHEIK